LPEFIFVYGSLKREGSAHHLLQAAKAEFVCTCEVKGEIVPNGTTTNLRVDYKAPNAASGELYLVRDNKLLNALDTYETPYKRRQVHPVSMPTLSAWVWII
jgi:gamma-glutamylcyclotransferase (GGCT)/AIG2-like uncharacterized protein YtfP